MISTPSWGITVLQDQNLETGVLTLLLRDCFYLRQITLSMVEFFMSKIGIKYTFLLSYVKGLNNLISVMHLK